MRVLIFGDSITQGFQDAAYGGWANRLHILTVKKIIESGHEYDVNVFTLGVSGDCTNRLLTRFNVEMNARARGTEKVFIFAIGVNDTQRYVTSNEIKTPIETFKNNIEALIERSKEHAKYIVFIGIAPIVEERLQPMPWASDRAHYLEDIEQYDSVLRNTCEQHELIYIGMDDVFGEMASEYLPDGIHPNTEGHQLMYERIKHTLEEKGVL